MARTALFDFVRNSMRIARASLHTEEPAAELLERWIETRRTNRREFIKGASVVAAGAAFTRCAGPLATAARSGDPVLIIGAGIAGLTTAYRLEQMGIPVRIVEAQGRVGGRMHSLRDYFPAGQVAELGGELIDTNHDSIRRLAAELGIELNDLTTDSPMLRQETWYFDGVLRQQSEVIEEFRPIARRIIEANETLGDDVTYREPSGGETLDTMSIADWFDAVGVDGWIRDLLEVAYTTEFGLEIDEQSALNFLTMIDPAPDPFHIFGESDERFHVRGGNDLIIQRLAERMSSPVEMRTALEAIAQLSDGRYECTVRTEGGSRAIRSSTILLTIPFTMLRRVDIRVPLPDVKRRAIDELGYGRNAKLMAGFARRVWREHGAIGSTVTDLPFQLCWETSRLQSGTPGILTNFTGGNHGMELGRGSTEEQASKFASELDEIYPGAAAAHQGMKQVRMHWPTHEWTMGSYASYRPGQWTSIRGAEGERVGQIFFAGEHTSLDWQGFMNGGCESGEIAAQAIAASLGRRARGEAA